MTRSYRLEKNAERTRKARRSSWRCCCDRACGFSEDIAQVVPHGVVQSKPKPPREGRAAHSAWRLPCAGMVVPCGRPRGLKSAARCFCGDLGSAFERKKRQKNEPERHKNGEHDRVCGRHNQSLQSVPNVPECPKSVPAHTDSGGTGPPTRTCLGFPTSSFGIPRPPTISGKGSRYHARKSRASLPPVPTLKRTFLPHRGQAPS